MTGPRSDILRIAVVGHTNTGKTSLLRTIARDAAFGDVSDRPSTTRHVSGIALLAAGEEVAHFLDTPGLEDSIGLLERLDALRGDRRLDGPAQIDAFLAAPDATGRFAPEALAIRAVLECDAAVYVIDARDRVLPKHRDELEILARCGRPIVPLLNFVAPQGPADDPTARVAAWRDMLARVNLHAVVEFDTVVFDQEGEIRLFEKLQTLLDRFRAPLELLIEDRRRRAHRLRRGASSLVAQLLVEAASTVESVESADRAESSAAEERLRVRVRDLERRCVGDLLALFGFRREDCDAAELPLVAGEWGLDLFSPAALRRHGLHAGGGAAAGAAVGAGIDLAVGGMTLGAAAGLGALIGAAIGGLGGSSRKLVRRARGGNELRAGDPTLRLLAQRQIELVRALLRRGHASVAPVRVGASAPAPGRRDDRAAAATWTSRAVDDLDALGAAAARGASGSPGDPGASGAGTAPDRRVGRGGDRADRADRADGASRADRADRADDASHAGRTGATIGGSDSAYRAGRRDVGGRRERASRADRAAVDAAMAIVRAEVAAGGGPLDVFALNPASREATIDRVAHVIERAFDGTDASSSQGR
ncbi:MAG: GTPase/DUF3482 domain-containing protein [Phycisphaerales bacterium]